MWGTGVPDEYTIPSLLAKQFKEHGVSNICITNFGQGGWVNTQEMLELIMQIKKGNIPNMVVFYDGVNDSYSAFQNKVAGIPENESNRIEEFNLLKNPKKMLFLCIDTYIRQSRIYNLIDFLKK